MLAIIPARAGSKGLPGKNIKKLLGKPLIAYTIEEALKSKYISEVYVSTDSLEIAKIAEEYVAKVPFLRPDYLATDQALAVDTYIFMLDKLQEANKNIESFIVLQPTSPLRTSKNIDEAITLFNDKDADSVISYTKESHPLLWHKYVENDLSFLNIFDDSKLSNRQENRTTYYPNGAIFVFKSEIIRQKKYYSSKSYAYIMDKNKSVDVDYMEDFEYAEFLLNKRLNDEKL